MQAMRCSATASIRQGVAFHCIDLLTDVQVNSCNSGFATEGLLASVLVGDETSCIMSAC